MDLNIYISTTRALSFHVCIHLQHITTQEQSNTVKCLHPGSDIMECLEEHVYDSGVEHSYIGHSPQRRDCLFLKHDTTKLQS